MHDYFGVIIVGLFKLERDVARFKGSFKPGIICFSVRELFVSDCRVAGEVFLVMIFRRPEILGRGKSGLSSIILVRAVSPQMSG